MHTHDCGTRERGWEAAGDTQGAEVSSCSANDYDTHAALTLATHVSLRDGDEAIGTETARPEKTDDAARREACGCGE